MLWNYARLISMKYYHQWHFKGHLKLPYLAIYDK